MAVHCVPRSVPSQQGAVCCIGGSGLTRTSVLVDLATPVTTVIRINEINP